MIAAVLSTRCPQQHYCADCNSLSLSLSHLHLSPISLSLVLVCSIVRSEPLSCLVAYSSSTAVPHALSPAWSKLFSSSRRSPLSLCVSLDAIDPPQAMPPTSPFHTCDAYMIFIPSSAMRFPTLLPFSHQAPLGFREDLHGHNYVFTTLITVGPI